MAHEPLWVPPGPIEKLLELAALMHIRNIVRSTGSSFNNASPELQVQGRQTVNRLTAMLDSELKQEISDFAKMRRQAR